MWKIIYEDNQKFYTKLQFTKETLKDHMHDTLKELKMVIQIKRDLIGQLCNVTKYLTVWKSHMNTP